MTEPSLKKQDLMTTVPKEKRKKSQSGEEALSDPAAAAAATGIANASPSIAAKRPRRGQSTARAEKSLVESVNALSIRDFSAQYLPGALTIVDAPGSESAIKRNLKLASWVEMSPRIREGCLDLVETTSSVHYQASEMRWSRARKRKEMRHPAMKYLLIRPPDADADDGIEGFVSFMVTEEDGYEVIYCYELHLQPSLRRKAIGRKLMEAMEVIGARVGVKKAMLTVFRSNEKALAAYRSWGYGIDVFSPEPRKLRDGTFKEPSYVILSKEARSLANETGGLEPPSQRPGIQPARKTE